MTSATVRITESFVVRELPGRSADGRQLVKLCEPLEYRVGDEDSARIIVVPCGFETDFASVPRVARGLFPALDRWGRPAIIHDFLYRVRGETDRLLFHLAAQLSEAERAAYLDLWRSRPDINQAPRSSGYTRAEADAVFAEAMAVVGVPAWRRTLMTRAVRAFGAGGWGT